MRRASRPPSIQGAPTRVKGSVVPRPSETLVPAKRQVPLYSEREVSVGRFGLGGVKNSPVSSKYISLFQPSMGTTCSGHSG